MRLKKTFLLLPILALSGCVASDPNKYLVGERGGKKLYEFGVTRHAAIGGEKAYKHQRDNFAKSLCPDGFSIVNEKYNGTHTVIGVRQAHHFLVTISCPA